MITIDIHKKLHAVRGIMDLSVKARVEKGRLVTIYGASGAGKTSTLRMLAGLMTPDGGRICVGNNTWFDAQHKINVKPQQRRIGFVFQDFALFPNMTVRQNLEFGLLKGRDKSVIEELIEITELGDLQHRQPEMLSGGQKQRVALARALVQRPEILLLDEPLSALDATTRLKLQDYILSIHKEYGLTTFLISHDISEIVKLSDHVLELKDGKVTRQGSPTELFVNKQLSGKFQFTGEVLDIKQQEVVYIVTVLIQNNVVKVIAQESEVKGLNKGDKVVVASKAFNPIIYKIE